MRARYLFLMAHLCGCGPAAVDEMQVTDFALLADGIDQYLAAQERAAAGG